ncbi:MAG: DUF5675 family protein [Imperialibacter sp.]|uniref:DUF5675 family protein n=1 Tax=Imperialibacter sp. TaxID=2038411 RepID=UPI0032EE68FA
MSFTVSRYEEDKFERYLNLKGLIEFKPTEEDAHKEEIRILITREKSNEYITIGSVRIEGTNIQGVTLELGRGTDIESNSPCEPDNRMRYECKRIPSGEYEFELNTSLESDQGQHVFRSIRLKAKEGVNRDGILIHRGNSYTFSWGCILSMYSSQLTEILARPSEFLNQTRMGYNSKAGNVAASEVFVMALYEYIKEQDPDGDLTKVVVIQDNEEETDLLLPTADFDLRKKAANYYYDLNVSNEADNLVANTPYKLIKGVLNSNGVLSSIVAKREEFRRRISLGENMNEQQIRAELRALWDQQIAQISDQLTTENLAETYDEETHFISPLSAWIRTQIPTEPQLNLVIPTMFEKRSDPNTPIQYYYLKEVNKESIALSGVKLLLNSSLTDTIAQIMEETIQ